MPTGVVAWFDDRTGEGKIRRYGREYPVTISEIEPEARVPHARVHFDIKRRQGVQWAVKVTLRRGRRVSPRQHRWGDLVGAHHPDEKGHHPLTDDHPGIDAHYEGRPVALIEEWARLINRLDLSTLRLLYAPEAVMHVGQERIVGRDAVIEWLREEMPGGHPQVDVVHGEDDLIGVELSVGDRKVRMDFHVAHGRVVEQWQWPKNSSPIGTP